MNKITHVLFDRIAILNLPVFSLEVVIRERNVSRITNDIYDLLVAVIEIFVALDDPGPGNGLQISAGLSFSVRNDPLDIRKRDWFIWRNEICDQKAGPGISRTWVGHNESVGGVNPEMSPGNIFSEAYPNGSRALEEQISFLVRCHAPGLQFQVGVLVRKCKSFSNPRPTHQTATLGNINLLTKCGLALAFLLVVCAMQGQQPRKVIYRTNPAYPPVLKDMGIGGLVRIVLVVTPAGAVKQTEDLGGNPILVTATEAAVKQWRFEPAATESREIVTLRFDPKDHR